MKKIIIMLIVTLLLFVQVACKNDLKDKIGQMSEIEEGDYLTVEVSSEDRIIISKSEDLSDYIVELFGIDDVATIVFNDTALVGLVISYDNELTEDLRRLITDLVIEKDKEIKQVVISDNKAIFKELVNIVNDLMNGKPYDNYVGSISRMISKVNKEN